MKVPIPIRVEDAIFAYCLYVAGIKENRFPTNTYNARMLEARGYKDSGIALEDAAKKEFLSKRRGHCEFWLSRDEPELGKQLEEIYRDQETQFKDERSRDIGEEIRTIMARAAGRDPETSDACEPMDEREAIVRILCIALKGRIAFVERVNDKRAAFLKIEHGEVTLRQDGNTYVEDNPGFDLIPLFGPRQ